MIPVAFLIAILFVTGQSLQVFYQIPGAMVQLIQAIIVMTVAAADFFTPPTTSKLKVEPNPDICFLARAWPG